LLIPVVGAVIAGAGVGMALGNASAMSLLSVFEAICPRCVRYHRIYINAVVGLVEHSPGGHSQL